MSSVPASALTIDLAAEAERIAGEPRRYVRHIFKRHGGVIGVSSSVDSATVLAFGPMCVSAPPLPNKDSSLDGVRRAQATGMPVAEVAASKNLDEAAVLRAFRDFERKRQTTTHPRLQPAFLAKATPDDDERP